MIFLKQGSSHGKGFSMKEISQLHEWFEANQRDFPWRVQKTPYRVLVSEIMLQQTRATVVVPYFEKWMEMFPTVQALAEAPLEQVIKAWEGLGYYSRARRLHAAAIYLVLKFGGSLPETKEDLASIPGLGPYTVGALLSFAFQKRAPAVDGNVARVLARYFLIEENIQKATAKRKLEQLAEKFLDEKKPWVTAEALIELGASICSRKPQCEVCPLQQSCLGRQSGKAEYLPLQGPSASTTSLFRSVF
jgi:A/G-specific DNA glycosylase